MRTVFKYEVPIRNEFTLELPRGAEILDVQVQRDQPQLWALVHPTNPLVKRTFHVVGMGHTLPNLEAFDHIGSFQLHDGALVFHLFETICLK